MKRHILNNSKGFTLIELMIVIAIIGILAAVALPNFISFRDKGYCSSVESDANSILGTLADHYAVPSHITAINGTINPGGTTLGPFDGANVFFKPLSNNNSATISIMVVNGANQMNATVTDASGRCPSGYKTSQSLAGWNNTASTFSKTM
jgi:type IV pilus assembly protein PilA